MMRITEAMAPVVATIEAATPLEGVADLMRARHCDVLPVTDKGEFIGLITAQDVLLALVAPVTASSKTSAQVVRSAPVHEKAMIGATATTDAAVRKMAEMHLDHLAVVDGQEVVGMVRLADLAPMLHGPGPTMRDRIARPAGRLAEATRQAWGTMAQWSHARRERRQSGWAA